MTFRRPSVPTVLAGAALFVALGGPAEAAKTLGLKNNSVTSKKIKNRTIATADLSRKTIAKLMVTPAGSIRAGEVADGSLTGAELAPGSVGGDRIAAGAIGADRIAANAVGGAAVADGSLGDADIGDNSISGNEIRNGSMSGADVGRFTGVLADLDFGTISSGACKTVSSTSLTAVTANQSLQDDAIVLTPRGAFPEVNLYAKAGGSDTIAVTVCNATANDLAVGKRSFNYVTFDAGGN